LNTRFAAASAALLLALTGCASSGSASAPPSSESADDRNKAIAGCGVVGKLLNGDIPVNADTYADVEKTLRTLASSGPGEVKTTAQFILDDIDGKHDASDAENEAQVEKFKNYCMNYTVD
jgi:hypothetical protein